MRKEGATRKKNEENPSRNLSKSIGVSEMKRGREDNRCKSPEDRV